MAQVIQIERHQFITHAMSASISSPIHHPLGTITINTTQHNTSITSTASSVPSSVPSFALITTTASTNAVRAHNPYTHYPSIIYFYSLPVCQRHHHCGLSSMGGSSSYMNKNHHKFKRPITKPTKTHRNRPINLSSYLSFFTSGGEAWLLKNRKFSLSLFVGCTYRLLSTPLTTTV
jgi:hypothetical protein